jgi:hypothetical protein
VKVLLVLLLLLLLLLLTSDPPPCGRFSQSCTLIPSSNEVLARLM